MDVPTEQLMWKVIEIYYQNRHLSQNKLESYNELVTEVLGTIMKNASPFLVHHKTEWHVFEVKNFIMSKPIVEEPDGETHTVVPNECRLRGLSYLAPAYIHLLWKVYILSEDVKSKTVDVPVLETKGKLIHCQLIPYVQPFSYPVMVKSLLDHLTDGIPGDKDCVYDDGAHFIINGKEKMLMYRERTTFNRVLCFPPKDVSNYRCQVRSEHAGKFRSTSTLYMNLVMVGRQKIQCLMIRLPYIDQLPFVLVMRALGIISDQGIMKMLMAVAGVRWRPWYKKVFYNALTQHQGVWTQRGAILRIGKAYKEKLIEGQYRVGMKNLNREVLPHLGSEETDFRKKAFYICYMACRFLDKIEEYELSGQDEESRNLNVFDDKDSYFNKNTETPLELMAGLTRQYVMNHYFPQVKKAILQLLEKKKPLNIYKVFNNIKVTKGICDALATGRWHATKGKATQTGVSQDMDRLNFLGTQAQHSKIINHLGKEGNHIAPRLLHNTTWGLICPFNSPEGQDCGLIKNITPMCHLSAESIPAVVIDLICQATPITRLEDLVPQQLLGLSKYGFLFVYGHLVGTFGDGDEVVKQIRRLRRTLSISPDIGVSVERWQGTIVAVHVRTDRGRNMRPLIILETWKRLTEEHKKDLEYCTWMDLLKLQVIEYVDALEQSTLCISMHVQDTTIHNPMYTHSELHGAMILGISASSVPYANHNQGPRVTYQCSMGKQAQGIHSSNMLDRMDTTAYQLWYPERPLIGTMLHEMLGFYKLPAGINVTAAIMSLDGGNQEDSLYIKQSAIDMGLFRSWVFHTASHKERDQGTQKDRFQVMDPNISVGRKRGDYSHIQADGLVKVGVRADATTVLMSRGTVLEEDAKGPTKIRDTSIMMKATQQGIIDKVMLTTEDDGLLSAKVRHRQICTPEEGDKFACYTPDHQVLTTKGWIPIGEVTKEHQVATLVTTEKGPSLVYQKPTEVQSYPYEGKMYCVKSNHIDLKVTPNHRMYVAPRPQGKPKKYRIETAEEIYGKRRHYKKNIDVYEPPEPMTEFILPAREGRASNDADVKNGSKKRKQGFEAQHLDLDAWLTFFGIWLAEGCTGGGKVGGVVVIAAYKERVKIALTDCCDKLGFHICRNRDGNLYNISSVQLCDYLKQFSLGAVNKCMPEWCWNLNPKQAQRLIMGMMLGDGHTMKNGTMRYDTSSTQLADDFQRLCLHAGWATNKKVKDKAGYVAYSKKLDVTFRASTDAYRLTVITKQMEPLVNKNLTQTQLDTWEDYVGNVYCCSVPDDGVIYVRRNGMPIWSGNTRYGQKGTAGCIRAEEDMPWMHDGRVVDMVANGLAFTSRMTFGMMLEMMHGTICAMNGKIGNGTPFSKGYRESLYRTRELRERFFRESNIQGELSDAMRVLGLQPQGNQVLYSGITGEPMQGQIFVGLTYYQKLKHMVVDKIRARARGRNTFHTRQPLEGRSRDGGIRFGEMEKDSVAAHGCSGIIQERLLHASAPYYLHVCRICNTSSIYANAVERAYCNYCDAYDTSLQIFMPYGFKSLMDDMQAVGLELNLKVEPADVLVS